MKRIIGNDGLLTYQVRWGRVVYTNTEVLIGIEYFRNRYPGEKYKLESAGQDYLLQVLPLYISANYLFDYIPGRFMVPYLGAGFDFYAYRNVRFDQGDRDWGIIKGFHGLGGLRFPLESVDLRAEEGYRDLYGVWRSFLSLEARYSTINNFGGFKRLVFSGWTYMIGVAFVF